MVAMSGIRIYRDGEIIIVLPLLEWHEADSLPASPCLLLSDTVIEVIEKSEKTMSPR
jgi:hypothetical protein